MKIWASAAAVRAEIADVPENWLIRFAATRPDDTRKLGESSNSKLLYRSSAVLEAIESGELKRPAGGVA